MVNLSYSTRLIQNKNVAEDKRLTIISDPLLRDRGPTRPVKLLAEELLKRGYEITIISPKVSEVLMKHFRDQNIAVVNLNFTYFLKDETLVMFETWVRENMLRRSPHKFSRPPFLLNFSCTLCVAADVWYVQGPVLTTVTLDSIYSEMPWHYKTAYKILKPLLRALDFKFVNRTARISNKAYANSTYTKILFKSLGINIKDVIFPPIDTDKFKPSKKTPSNDFVLTYFGKETKYSTVEKIADAGVKVKAFGGKLAPLSKKILNHPHLEYLGEVTDNQLVSLYSNAMFTIFPFTNEPFGYIPIESMACCTPVLSFNRQGPAETILNDKTGWLVNTDEEMVRVAKRLWKYSYDPNMRYLCMKHVKNNFDKKLFAAKFLKVFENT